MEKIEPIEFAERIAALYQGRGDDIPKRLIAQNPSMADERRACMVIADCIRAVIEIAQRDGNNLVSKGIIKIAQRALTGETA